MSNINISKNWFSILSCCLFFLALNLGNLSAQRIYGLSGSNLVWFDATAPSAGGIVAPITGISTGQTLAGLDFRPLTGQLYGVGYNNSTGETRLYTLNLSTGVATAIGAAAITTAPNMGDITFDFNPTVDRIRFMGSNKLNFRLHPITGGIAATDGSLAFSATDVNAGVDPSITSSAYTNSYIATTSTTLYNYDKNLNIFTSQIPPNNGTLNTIGATGLSVNPVGASADLDIFFDATTATNIAYLAANNGTNANDDLYSINIATGQTTLIGSINMPISNIAVQIDRTVPALMGDLLYGLTSNNWLISFDAMNPSVVRTAVAVTGVAAGQVLSGLDFRAATGELYGVGYNNTTGETRLYTIHLNTGAATAIGANALTLAQNMNKISFDFNPTVDRIRFMGSNNLNYRLHPATGAIAATDGSLAFNAGDVNFGTDPSIGTSAYTNSFAGTTTTTLYNFDDSLTILTAQIPPNDGKLNSIGNSGIMVNLADQSTDMDIYYDKTTGTNRAYLIANTGTSGIDVLYTVNLTTGALTMVGKIGNGSSLGDLAAFISPRASIVCPATITVQAPQGSASMVVNYNTPVVASGCLTGITAPMLSTGLASGSAFPGGVSTVCYTVTDNCSNSNSCCFNVTVKETACDVKNSGCVQYEMLSVSINAQGKKVVRIRVTNNCASALDYVALQVQNGTTASSPANNSTYTTTSGTNYTVRSPNFSPFYSIRFKTQGQGIKNGQSDIFQYEVPQVTGLRYFHVLAKTDDGQSMEAYLNTFDCGLQASQAAVNTATKPSVTERTATSDWAVYPNPSDGALILDLSAVEGNWMNVAIYDITGQLMLRQTIDSESFGAYDFSNQIQSWATGIYLIQMATENGARKTVKWTLKR